MILMLILPWVKDWIKRKDNIIIFNKPNIKPKVFKILLKYFYTGTRVQQAYSSYAIKDLSSNGVSFGNDDLAFFVGACNKSYYEKRILDTTTFNMEDFEVFRVVKNK
ncbi:unnamed protein product [Rhizophagus irregularis]|nr:unnamed protein product [Rhizophagus irregularis]